MKETQSIGSDKIEIVKQPQQIKKITFVGSLIKKPNMKVYEASILTGDVFLAEMEMQIDTKGKAKHVVKVKENHIYCYALNDKNAMRKFEKMLRNGRLR